MFSPHIVWRVQAMTVRDRMGTCLQGLTARQMECPPLHCRVSSRWPAMLSGRLLWSPRWPPPTAGTPTPVDILRPLSSASQCMRGLCELTHTLYQQSQTVLCCPVPVCLNAHTMKHAKESVSSAFWGPLLKIRVSIPVSLSCRAEMLLAAAPFGSALHHGLCQALSSPRPCSSACAMHLTT